MRHQEINVEDTQREITKISRQIQVLSDNCQRSSGDSYEILNRKRKMRGALEHSVRYLSAAQRIVGSEPLVQSRTPVLTKQSLRKLVFQGRNLKDLAEYFGVAEQSIMTSMRIFGISFPKKDRDGAA